MYSTMSVQYDTWKEMAYSQATIPNIGADKYAQLPVTLPNRNEQIECTQFLDRKCAEIDAILDDKRRQVEVMKEQRKSVIYEYVTGKKRVKEAV